MFGYFLPGMSEPPLCNQTKTGTAVRNDPEKREKKTSVSNFIPGILYVTGYALYVPIIYPILRIRCMYGAVLFQFFPFFLSPPPSAFYFPFALPFLFCSLRSASHGQITSLCSQCVSLSRILSPHSWSLYEASARTTTMVLNVDGWEYQTTPTHTFKCTTQSTSDTCTRMYSVLSYVWYHIVESWYWKIKVCMYFFQSFFNMLSHWPHCTIGQRIISNTR